MDLTDVADRLRGIEEDLRDRAYEALQEAANGDEEAAKLEKRLLSARRGIEKAIRALDPGGGFDEGP